MFIDDTALERACLCAWECFGVLAGCVEGCTRVHKQVPRGSGCAKPRRGPLWGRCVFSAAGEGGDEGGWVCFIHSHSCFPLIQKDLREGMRGTHATHTHMTNVVSHTFIHSRRGARMASCQLFGTVTFPYSQLPSSSPLCRGSRSTSRNRKSGRPLTKVSIIPLIDRNVQYCKNPCCTCPVLKRSYFTCLSSGICHECKITSF